MKQIADAGKVDEQHKHEDKQTAIKLVADAAKHDSEQAAQGVNPEEQAQQHQQELAHAQQIHEQQLAQGRQQAVQAYNVHQQKQGHAQQTHEQKMKHAEEQRLINAAIQAAKPHMGEK
jgi:hypothetical protein